MKIENLRSVKNGDRTKIVADVSWENCDRPRLEVYFETNAEFTDRLLCNPHAFLIPCVIAAKHYGEERVFIDEEICPELLEGLKIVMGWFDVWYNWYGPPVQIESKIRSRMPFPRIPDRAGFFFSGGIDSLATLRSNRINYHQEHPGSIKDALLVFGLEVREQESFEHVLNSLSILAKDANITLIPVYTNIRYLGPDDFGEFWFDFWPHEYQGAAFSAIAHAFSKRLTSIIINSSHDIPTIMPQSTHPLIDPNYSSSDLQIRHYGITLSRIAKTRLISDWDIALKYLRVCNRSQNYQSGVLNCGKCEKCLRTMLGFLTMGVLEKTSAFPFQDVTKEMLLHSGLKLSYPNFRYYRELIDPLKQKGRHDLVNAIEHILAKYYRAQKLRNLKSKIIKYDDKYLRGYIAKCKGITLKRILKSN